MEECYRLFYCYLVRLKVPIYYKSDTGLDRAQQKRYSDPRLALGGEEIRGVHPEHFDHASEHLRDPHYVHNDRLRVHKRKLVQELSVGVE